MTMYVQRFHYVYILQDIIKVWMGNSWKQNAYCILLESGVECPTMPKNGSTVVGKNCFPDHPKESVLPRSVPHSEIAEIIDRVHQRMLDQISQLFASTSHANNLQKARGHLADFTNQLKEDIGIDGEGTPGDIRTYGELADVGRAAYALLRMRAIGHREYKNRKMNPELVRILRQEIDDTVAAYQLAMAPQKDNVIASQGESTIAPDVDPPAASIPEAVIVRSQQMDPASSSESVVLSENSNILAQLNQYTELNPLEFPQPLHGYWDLDALAQHHTHVPPTDTVPSWVRLLLESEATRLLALLSDSSNRLHRNELDKFFATTQSFCRSNQNRSLARDAVLSSSDKVKKQIEEWISRHSLDGYPEQDRKYVYTPGYLRRQEQIQLMQPNIERIVAHHFSRVSVPLAQRRLVDIGTWDGEMPRTLRSHFGEMIGIEPNDKRFDLLAANPTVNLIPLNTDMQTILRGECPHDLHAHAFLFSHVLYFMQQEDIDLEALQWAVQHADNNGIVIIVLNDTMCEIASRAHMRKVFGVREQEGTPQYYEQFFQRKGIATRTMRPTLHVKAHTPEGKVAMRELMQLLLPGETRHNQSGLDVYQSIIDGQGGVLKHTLNILIAYKNPTFAPVQPAPREIPKCFPAPASAGGNQVGVKTKGVPHQIMPAPDPGDFSFEPIGDKIGTLEPSDVLKMLDVIAERTWGEEQSVRRILSQLDVDWSMYQFWLQNRRDYEIADKILRYIKEHSEFPEMQSIGRPVYALVIQSLRRQHNGSASLEPHLRQLGLYARYCRLIGGKPERRRKIVRDEGHTRVLDSPRTEQQTSVVHTGNGAISVRAKVDREKKAPAPKVSMDANVAMLTDADRRLLSERDRMIDLIVGGDMDVAIRLLTIRESLIDSISRK